MTDFSFIYSGEDLEEKYFQKGTRDSRIEMDLCLESWDGVEDVLQDGSLMKRVVKVGQRGMETHVGAQAQILLNYCLPNGETLYETPTDQPLTVLLGCGKPAAEFL